jgi:hypothetical protein
MAEDLGNKNLRCLVGHFKQSFNSFPKGLNIIAGGIAPGTTHELIADPEGVAHSI